MSTVPTPDLRPVSARSALLGLLLGAEQPSLSAGELVAGGRLVGFAEQAVRVALSRMVAGGDLSKDDEGRYRLSERLLLRQRRQEAAILAPTNDWNGDWQLVLITSTGRSAADRAALRTTLTELRLGELREGVWLRPTNIDLDWPDGLDDSCERGTMRPRSDPAALAARLWDLAGWSVRARGLLAATDTDDPVLRFTACASAVRHLLEDPLLPDSLLPADWPGDELRRSHLAYRDWLIQTRRDLTDQRD